LTPAANLAAVGVENNINPAVLELGESAIHDIRYDLRAAVFTGHG
jgi:hypothetical protein